jgi:hypothetical protein
MESGKFTMQESNFFVLVLRKKRRDDGDRPVSVVTVVTGVTIMGMFVTLPLENVMNHPRTGDRGWIQGGHVQRIEK